MSRYFFLSALLLVVVVSQQDDLQFGQALETLPRTQVGTVDAVNYNSDGSRMITLTRNVVTVWTLGGNGQFTRLQNMSIGGPLYFAQISPDGSKIAAGGNNSTIHLWQLNTANRTYGSPQSLRQPGDSVSAAINTLAFDSEGRLVSGSSDGTVNIWRQTANNNNYEFVQKLSGHIAAVREVSAKRRYIVTAGGTDGTVRIWSKDAGAQNYRQVQQVSSSNGVSIETARLSQDESLLILGFSNGTLIIMANTRRDVPFASVQSMLQAHPNGVLATAISSDSSKFISIGKDGVPSYWVKPSLNAPFNRIKRLQEDANAVDFDRRNNIAVGVREGNGSQVVIYNLVTNCSQVVNSTKVNINKIDCECVAGTVWIGGACQKPQPVSTLNRALTDGITLQSMENMNLTGMGMGLIPSITTGIFAGGMQGGSSLQGGSSSVQGGGLQGSLLSGSTIQGGTVLGGSTTTLGTTQGSNGLLQSGTLQGGQSGQLTSTVTTITTSQNTAINNVNSQNLNTASSGTIIPGSTVTTIVSPQTTQVISQPTTSTTTTQITATPISAITGSLLGGQTVTTGLGGGQIVNGQNVTTQTVTTQTTQSTSGQTITGQDGQVVNGQLVNVNGQVVNGQVVNGQVVNGQAANTSLVTSLNNQLNNQVVGTQSLGTQVLGTQVTGSQISQPVVTGSQTITTTSQTSGTLPITTTSLTQPATIVQPSTTTTIVNGTRTTTTVTTRLDCAQVKFSTGKLNQPTGDCQCIRGYFFSNLLCYRNCSDQKFSTKKNIGIDACQCIPGYSWVPVSNDCQQMIMMVTIPGNQTITTEQKVVNVINCGTIRFSTGINSSLTSCFCILGFRWVEGACRRQCNIANSNGITVGIDACICNLGFVWRNNQCEPVRVGPNGNITIVDTTVVTLFNCSQIINSLGGPPAERCTCRQGYRWYKNLCFIDCGLLPNTAGMDTIYTCKCAPGFMWMLKECVRAVDCTRVANVALNRPQTKPDSCPCADGYQWMSGRCYPVILPINCNLIARAVGPNPQMPNTCLCAPNYIWQNNNCLRNCNNVEGALQSDPNNPDACICRERYVRVNNECNLNCSNFSNAVGFVNSRPQSCSCNISYFWRNGSCVLDCQAIPNTVQSDKNVPGQCMCKPNFVWTNGTCALDCKNVPMANGTINRTHCSCANGYQWAVDKCQVVCSRIKYTTGALKNQRECVCTGNYIWYEGACTRDCFRIPGGLKPDNTRPDGCICSQAYLWNNQSNLCQINCPAISNSAGTPRKQDGSCECKSGFSWVQKNLACVRKSAGSKLGLILPLAIGIPLGLCLLSGLICLCCCIPGCCCGPKVAAPMGPIPYPVPMANGNMNLQEVIMPPTPTPFVPPFVPLPTQKTFQTINTIETIPPVNSVIKRTERSVLVPPVVPISSTLGRVENTQFLHSIGSSGQLDMPPLPPPQVLNQVISNGTQFIGGQATITNPVATSLVPSGITFASGAVGGLAQGGVVSGIQGMQGMQSGIMSGGIMQNGMMQNGMMQSGMINGVMQTGMNGVVPSGINQGALIQGLHGIIQPPMTQVITSPVVNAMPFTTVVQGGSRQSFADVPEYGEEDDTPPFTLIDNKTGKKSYHQYPFGRNESP